MKKSGFVTIAGKPNVGKSTLLNRLVGEKISIVTHKPQTTRNSITGVLNTKDAQIVFLDTPGFHNPKTRLGDIMVKSISSALADSDIVLFIVEPVEKLSLEEQKLLERLIEQKRKIILIINKIDTVKKEALIGVIQNLSKLYDFVSIIPISAKDGDGVALIIKEIESHLSEGIQYFPDDMVTNQPEKQIIAEIIREKALKSLQDEIPHGIAIEVETLHDRGESNIIDISVNIFCEKETHKGIIIGKGGQMLKLIATRAREDLEELFDCKVNLQCWVKVKEDWRNRNNLLKNFGFDI